MVNPIFHLQSQDSANVLDTDVHIPTILPGTQALGLGGSSESDAEQSSLAASVNRATCDEALRLVPAPARERYERRGRRLHFVPDRRALRLAGCHADRD